MTFGNTAYPLSKSQNERPPVNIKPQIYESLTPRQRVIASIEALARGDEEEKRRLVKSCPKKSYLRTDAAYADTMDLLICLSVAIEADLRGCALNYFFASWQEGKDGKPRTAFKQASLQNMADIIQAWRNALKNQGIDPNTMEIASRNITHFLVEWLEFEMFDPDPEQVKKFQDILEENISRSYGAES